MSTLDKDTVPSLHDLRDELREKLKMGIGCDPHELDRYIPILNRAIKYQSFLRGILWNFLGVGRTVLSRLERITGTDNEGVQS